MELKFVYLLISGEELEDIKIFLNHGEAIKESIKNPNLRVEIFGKDQDYGYVPTYNYYKHGKLIYLV
jgi:hypothetical protein